jgi:hypothetical protein
MKPMPKRTFEELLSDFQAAVTEERRLKALCDAQAGSCAPQNPELFGQLQAAIELTNAVLAQLQLAAKELRN